MKTPKNNSRRYPLRRGLAAFEFIMLFPLMIAMITLVIYVGKVGVQQLNYANDLHFETWRQRYVNQPADIEPLVFANEKQGKIEGGKSEVIKTDLIYDAWKHEKKTSAKVYANSWSANSHWNGESKWATSGGLGGGFGGGLTAEDNEKNNQRIFYNQKHNKTYARNLPYYNSTSAMSMRNTDYVSPVGK